MFVVDACIQKCNSNIIRSFKLLVKEKAMVISRTEKKKKDGNTSNV